MERNIKKIVEQMTLEEKASFCTGKDFWHTQDLERLGIPSMMVTDGPHGLRKQTDSADHLGIGGSNPAICFPAGCTLASSFDPKLAELVGNELGKLAQAEDIGVVLGPAMNMKRSPLCGRNFEYYSEDPLVSSKMATGTVNGIQSQKVGTSPKHFLANNQEYYRMSSDSIVDERTLREIYLASFEGMVKEAKPWTMMCSYNRVNGTYVSENKKMLSDILKEEWGYEGCVLTDWGACDDPVESMKAGLDLEMPGPVKCNERKIIEAVQKGELSIETLDQAVEKILMVTFNYYDNHVEDMVYDFDTGHNVAKKVAEESAVLLKNEDNVLPVKESERVVIIGEYAKNPRYQGGGSSHVHPYQVTNAWEYLKDREGVAYEKGFDDRLGIAHTEAAVAAAENADKAIIFAGLPESYESEGIDRKNLDLPMWQNELIEAVAEAQPNTIVVLHNGAPVAMPWIKSVKAVLEMYLGGEATGEATADLLYGKANPCGHLAETFPVRLEDTPAYPYYGVEKDEVHYREGVLIGYRYYETMKREVLFPFGHGLSYTEFEYSNLEVEKEQIEDTETLHVNVTVKNIGTTAGKTLVQLYIGNPVMQQIVRPVRELRRFQKIYLEPGEEKTVTFLLNKRDFSYWNETIHNWHAATGEYKIQIGKSASEIICEKEVNVISTEILKPVYTVNSPMGDIMENPVAATILTQMIKAAGGNEDMSSSEFEGGVISNEALDAAAQMTTLRGLIYFSPDADIDQMQQLVDGINAQIQEK